MHTTLITAADLAAHLDTPDWVIVDCRHDLMNPAAGREAYAAGHLPGAVFADNLSPHKARILLMLLLQGARTPHQLQSMFDQ